MITGVPYIIEGGEVIVKNTEVSLNTADADNDMLGNGGGMYLVGSAYVLLDTCGIHQNNAYQGGGTYAAWGATVVVERAGSYYWQNRAAGNGGGLGVDRAVLQTYALLPISQNSALNGGGVFATNQAQVTLGTTNGEVALVQGNSAYLSGGGLYAVDSGTVVRAWHVTFGQNSLGEANPVLANIAHGGSTHSGGAVAVFNGAQCEAVNCRFFGNIASNNGGAVYVVGGTALLRSEFGSVAATQPLTRVWNNTAKYGAAGYVVGGSLSVYDADVISNRASAAASGWNILARRGQS